MKTTWNSDQEYSTPSVSLSQTLVSTSEAVMGFDESCPSKRSVNTGRFNRKEQKRKTCGTQVQNNTHVQHWVHCKMAAMASFGCKWLGPMTCVWFLCSAKIKMQSEYERTLLLHIGHCDFRHFRRWFQWTVQNADHPDNQTDDARFIECYLR